LGGQGGVRAITGGVGNIMGRQKSTYRTDNRVEEKVKKGGPGGGGENTGKKGKPHQAWDRFTPVRNKKR